MGEDPLRDLALPDRQAVEVQAILTTISPVLKALGDTDSTGSVNTLAGHVDALVTANAERA